MGRWLVNRYSDQANRRHHVPVGDPLPGSRSGSMHSVAADDPVRRTRFHFRWHLDGPQARVAQRGALGVRAHRGTLSRSTTKRRYPAVTC